MKFENTTGKPGRRWYQDACGAALALEFLGERWSILIVRELLLGPRRFGELRGGLIGVSANILSQRLAGLEADGVVRRRRLPPPASVQVYELTAWGREAEPIVMALGRWALRSPTHDPTLPMTAVALMLSLRMLLVPERVGDFRATLGFRLGEDGYCVRVTRDGLAIAPGDPADSDAAFEGHPNAFLPLFYGGQPLEAADVRVSGDGQVAERFAGLFALPEKHEG